jgi:hypothetical protein
VLSQWIDPIDDYSEAFSGQATTIGLTAKEWVGLLVCTLLVLVVVGFAG